MAAKDEVGRRGEALAAEYLAQRGYEILERNWRCHAGEIDIVARDLDTVVIVEVKTRSSTQFGHPFEALTPSKLARLYRLAVLWCAAHQARAAFRVDAIAVLNPSAQAPTIEHLRAVQ